MVGWEPAKQSSWGTVEYAGPDKGDEYYLKFYQTVGAMLQEKIPNVTRFRDKFPLHTSASS